jgi:hypothetical protein
VSTEDRGRSIFGRLFLLVVETASALSVIIPFLKNTYDNGFEDDY